MAKPKKRGVKPGTKRGPYRKAKRKLLRIRVPNDFIVSSEAPKVVGNLPSLISELSSTISQLEAQLTGQIDRIKSILN